MIDCDRVSTYYSLLYKKTIKKTCENIKNTYEFKQFSGHPQAIFVCVETAPIPNGIDMSL